MVLFNKALSSKIEGIRFPDETVSEKKYIF